MTEAALTNDGRHSKLASVMLDAAGVVEQRRLNALNAAATYAGSAQLSAYECLKLAKEFEAYLKGD